MSNAVPEYGWSSPDATGIARHLLPQVRAIAKERGIPFRAGTRVLDVGCGNGFVGGSLLADGCDVTGVDASHQGVEIARQTYPGGRWEQGEIADDLPERLGGEPFDVVVSTEVVEHLFAPKAWARVCRSALRPGGILICSTPYHGYLKNLSISLAGKWGRHADPLWDGGHIKLWSPASLRRLLNHAGFGSLEWRGVGRIPYLWKSMLMSGVNPPETR